MVILLTTSLRPSPRTRTFCNDLAASCAAFSTFTRGKSSLVYLMELAKTSGASRLWVVHSRFGGPSLIECYDPTKGQQCASFLLKRVQLLREIGVRAPKSTRHRPLALVPPESGDLAPLYECLKLALGADAQALPKKSTEIHIQIARGNPEVFFIDSESKLPCGPAIFLKGYRCGR